MIKNDFKIDFEKKKIFHIEKNKKVYSANQLYSFLQDLFDELENMKYEIPIVAKSNAGRYPTKSKTEYQLVNGWTLDEKSLKHLKGNITANSE